MNHDLPKKTDENGPDNPIRISVVIPTWNRVDFLEKAFQGLREQLRQADEVIVGVRREDQNTLQWIATQRILQTGVKTALLDIPGVVASMQSGVDHSTGDIVCLLDDDARPYPDWLQRIERYFQSNPRLGAIGGRDILAYLKPGEVDSNLQTKVGVFTWYGKFFANHHCGTGGYRKVHVLKGCNCSFRGEIIREVGFDTTLAGWDTQTHWETALCLDVANEGFEVGYDPLLKVLHFVAPRHGPDQNYRGGYSEEGIYHMAHNLAYVMHTRKRFPCMIDLYAVIIGTKDAPGLLQWIRLRLRKEPTANSRFKATMRGYLAGLRTARKEGVSTSG